jgi:DNA-directed RNA polymerase subunit RPC12/RpoP
MKPNWFEDYGHKCVECGRMYGTVVVACECGSRRLYTVPLEPHVYCRTFQHVLIEQGPVAASKKLLKRETREDGIWQLFRMRWQLKCKRCGAIVYEERDGEERV